MESTKEHQGYKVPDIFYVGGEYIQDERGTHMTGQMCVRHYGPGNRNGPAVIFIHGAAQTGTHFEQTPDGQPGLAQLQALAGWDSYVVDQPGVGRSRYDAQDLGPLAQYTVEELEFSFTRPEPGSWPTAHLHTQWPGTGKKGDPYFDAFYASQVGHIAGYKKVERLIREVARPLLSVTGPAYLVTHSQSGPLGWTIADECPELVRGIIALEPHGPPFEYPDCAPFNKRREIVGRLVHPFGITSNPLQYSPPLGPLETQLEYEQELEGSHGKDSLVGCRQKVPARHLVNLASVPVVIITAEASYHASYDHLTAQFLRDAGVTTDHIYLADVGVRGNGHLMAIERNHHDVQHVINDWLEKAAGI